MNAVIARAEQVEPQINAFAEQLFETALAQALNNGIEIVLKHTDLGDSRVGVYVQDADTGEVLAALRDTEPLIPASNMKLLTTGAALAVLGSEFTFRTELRRAGDTLVLKGSGDPALADPDLLASMGLGVEDLIDTWIEAIRNSGEQAPTKLIVDATIFDREFVQFFALGAVVYGHADFDRLGDVLQVRVQLLLQIGVQHSVRVLENGEWKGFFSLAADRQSKKRNPARRLGASAAAGRVSG